MPEPITFAEHTDLVRQANAIQDALYAGMERELRRFRARIGGKVHHARTQIQALHPDMDVFVSEHHEGTTTYKLTVTYPVTRSLPAVPHG